MKPQREIRVKRPVTPERRLEKNLEDTMKRALLVGIDEYDNYRGLTGCVNDVHALLPLLATHANGDPNFDCRALFSGRDKVTRKQLLGAIDSLLAPGANVGLLYFAGHGIKSDNDVVLTTQDGDHGDPGVPLADVLGRIRASRLSEIIVILDCCFSGAAGGVPQLGGDIAALRKGLSLLTASRDDQPAAETSEARGMFSSHLCGALDGGAADVVGKVTLAGIYSYLSESFGPWGQRPTFKAHLDHLHDLRRCSPAVPMAELRRLPDIFETADADLPLDPSYEPTEEPKDEDREEVFAILQTCRAAKLVEPIDEEHMYWAAMHSTGCRLTPLGALYWNMASEGRL